MYRCCRVFLWLFQSRYVVLCEVEGAPANICICSWLQAACIANAKIVNIDGGYYMLKENKTQFSFKEVTAPYMAFLPLLGEQ